MSTQENNKGLTRIINAMFNTVAGFKATWKSEEAFRQEVWICMIALPAGYWLGETGLERALLVGSLLWVLTVELLNSGIEAVVDRVGMEHHELSGRAKDMGSAAVFLSIAQACLVWFFILA